MSSTVTTERRRRERIYAAKGAFAFSGGQHGQIIDANLQGLSFQYITGIGRGGERYVQKGMGEGSLDIVLGAYDFTLAGLPVQTVADFQVANRQNGQGRRGVRRRVVTFGQLSPDQLFSLKRFLLLSRYGAMHPTPSGKPIEKKDGNRS